MRIAEASAKYSALRQVYEQWCGVRSRLLMNQKFQRLSSKLPFSRAIARKSSSDIFDLVAGFVYSQILLACVQLRLFDHLKSGPRSLNELSRLMDLKPEAARRLLEGAASLRLVTLLHPERYCLGFRGAAIAGNEGVLRMIEHHTLLYADLADPVALLRGDNPPTSLSRYWSYCVDEPHQLTGDRVARYTQLMSQSQALVSSQILDAYPFKQHRTILDIGGGDGTFLRTVAAHAAHIDLMLFDVPAVVQLAQERFDSAGLGARARVFGGDFFRDPLPEGADLISLVRVVHDHDNENVMTMLRRVRQVLAPGGTLMLAEPMAGAVSSATVGDAYFNFYLMAMGAGRARTADEIARMLHAAGFASVIELKTNLPVQCKILIAQVDAKKRKANLT